MSEHADATLEAAPASPRRKRRWLRAVGWTALGLVMLAATLYAFGGMWVRTPEMRAAYDAMVARGEQPKLPSGSSSPSQVRVPQRRPRAPSPARSQAPPGVLLLPLSGA